MQHQIFIYISIKPLLYFKNDLCINLCEFPYCYNEKFKYSFLPLSIVTTISLCKRHSEHILSESVEINGRTEVKMFHEVQLIFLNKKVNSSQKVCWSFLLDSDPHYHWSGILYSLRGSVATVLSGVT
jgi:hypothetical protein